MSELRQKIAAEIEKQGAISFARFMELALYCPVYGYYEKEADTIGRQGDFYTSVSVGSLFGELLAFQFADWLQGGGPGSAPGRPVFIAEAGAHRGDLARDILAWTREHRPDLFERLDYWIIEPSDYRQRCQQAKLAEFASRVHWVENLQVWINTYGHPPGAKGVVFANELLDAFPVHRLAWDAPKSTWFEWGVGLSGGRFVWKRLPEEKSLLRDSDSALALVVRRFESVAKAGVLPHGFIIEASPEAIRWWNQAATLLSDGKLLTIDYGFTNEELLAPERAQGTLRAYRRHQQLGDALDAPGEQDLTAHIDFQGIQQAGERAGLVTEALVSQAEFLTAVASRSWIHGQQFSQWTPERRRQFLTLTHPEHLGRAFRVLVQSRAPTV